MATSPEVQQLSGELRQLTQALQNLVSASSRTAQAQQAQYDALLSTREQLSKYRNDLVQGRTLNKEQRRIVAEAIKAKEKEIQNARALNKANNELLVAQRKTSASSAELERAQRNVARASTLHVESQQRTAEIASELDKSMQGVTTASNYTNAALVYFGKTLYTQGAQLLAQNKAMGGVAEGSGSVILGLMGDQLEALKSALSGAELAEIAAKNRQVVNSLGGTDAAFTEFQATIKRTAGLTGFDFKKAAELTAEAATEFAKKGVRPASHTLEAFVDDVVEMQKRTELSAEESMAMFNRIANDDSTIELLRKARGDERESILQSQRALVKQSIALGMSTEQAEAAAKVMSKMAAAKPLDRLKQAAKIRALGGALGIEGAEGAARAIQAGSRATDEDKKNLQQFNINAANTIDAAAQQGLPAEIFATTLVDKLGLEQYFGPGNPFSTSLGDTLKPAFEDVTKAYREVSKTAEGAAALRLAQLKQQAELILSGNNILGNILSVIGLIATAVVAKGALGKLGGLSGLGEKAGGLLGKAKGVGGIAGGADKVDDVVKSASTLQKAGSLLGGIAKFGSVAGTLIQAGSTVNELGNGQRKESLELSDALNPAAWGAFVGENLINKPFEAIVGDSIGGKIYDWFNGDKVGQMLNQTQLPSTSRTSSTRPDIVNDAIAKTAEVSTAMNTAAKTTADAVTEQVKKISTSNDLLTQIADMTKKQVEIAEKQLVALTLSENERQTGPVRSQLRSNNRFASEYGYV